MTMWIEVRGWRYEVREELTFVPRTSNFTLRKGMAYPTRLVLLHS